MPRFSLVVPTLGRTAELAKLFTSITEQRRTDVEVVIVDQNEDDRVVPLVAALIGLSVIHLRTQEKNVSRARNIGMDAASGQILGFPDDDCWYPANLLNQVDCWLTENPEFSVLAVGSLDDQGIPSGNRWIQKSCDITPFNALRTTFCSSLFISAVQESRAIRFDENLNRGEETDFILRLLATGLRGRFERKFYICHPRRDMLSGTVSKERAVSYGAGMGQLVRRHSLPFLWLTLLSYDLARFLVVCLKGEIRAANFCLAHTQGLFWGFILPHSQQNEPYQHALKSP